MFEADLTVGKGAIFAYSRLSYTMWYALAEFIDNSTQSRFNYENIIDDVLRSEGKPLIVEIEHHRLRKTISINDNSIGMNYATLVEALKIANPTQDSRGRSKYGMGMKTAACWIGSRWKVITCEWGSGEEWTAEVDVKAIVEGKAKVPLTKRNVDTNEHYTKIIIEDLQRTIQNRTEENIRSYLGSMYRFDLMDNALQILYNGVPISVPTNYDFDTDSEGRPMQREIPETNINGKTIRGWIGVLRKGGRKFGGFSIFQNRRQIQGFPSAWKPRSIFGGVDDEGANNLISQRLVGLVELDGFDVSHTKDAILFKDNEEEQLEGLLEQITRDYRSYALKRRTTDRGQPWSRDKVADLLKDMEKEFTNDEMKDAINTTLLPPLENILATNQQQAESVNEDNTLATIEVVSGLRVVISFQERSEYEPHLTITTNAGSNDIYLIINGYHPYYSGLDSPDAIDECIRQYIYDAMAEFRVNQLTSRVNPDSVRRFKDSLLRVGELRIKNRAALSAQEGDGDAFLYINKSPDSDG